MGRNKKKSNDRGKNECKQPPKPEMHRKPPLVSKKVEPVVIELIDDDPKSVQTVKSTVTLVKPQETSAKMNDNRPSRPLIPKKRTISKVEVFLSSDDTSDTSPPPPFKRNKLPEDSIPNKTLTPKPNPFTVSKPNSPAELKKNSFNDPKSKPHPSPKSNSAPVQKPNPSPAQKSNKHTSHPSSSPVPVSTPVVIQKPSSEPERKPRIIQPASNPVTTLIRSPSPESPDRCKRERLKEKERREKEREREKDRLKDQSSRHREREREQERGYVHGRDRERSHQKEKGPREWEEKRDSKRNGEIPANWLDVSSEEFLFPLIIESRDRNNKAERGSKVRSTFKSLYDKYGRFTFEILSIKTEEFNIKLHFKTSLARYQFRKDLEYIVANSDRDCNLTARNLRLVKPCISFISLIDINSQNQADWMRKIKRVNKWPESSELSWVETLPSEESGKYQIKICVDSQIRTMIEKDYGQILIRDEYRVDVYDEFGIARCRKCLEFGHLKFDCKRVYEKCFFCFKVRHPGQCSLKFYPELWWCGLCKARGHSAISKECPTLRAKLVAVLEKIEHRYRYIFLEPHFGREVCQSVLDDCLGLEKRPKVEALERAKGLSAIVNRLK